TPAGSVNVAILAMAPMAAPSKPAAGTPEATGVLICWSATTIDCALLVTGTVNVPSSTYVWSGASTLYTPPPRALTVPADVVPSPHTIVATKSAAVSTPSPAGSVNVAIPVIAPMADPSKPAPGTPEAAGVLICWSDTTIVWFGVVTDPNKSCTSVTLTV